MINILEIDGYKALIQFDPEIEMFRGEFLGLNGGADFYAKTTDELKREAKISLDTFIDICQKRGIEPKKSYSGKFNVRISPELHEAIAAAATSSGESLNQWVAEHLEESLKLTADP